MGEEQPTAAPVLAARAQVTPAYFQQYNRADLSSACSCLSLTRPTITRTVGANAIATSTITRTRNIVQTTTLPVPLSTAIAVQPITLTVTLQAPVVTNTVVSLDQSYGCAPGTTPAL